MLGSVDLGSAHGKITIDTNDVSAASQRVGTSMTRMQSMMAGASAVMGGLVVAGAVKATGAILRAGAGALQAASNAEEMQAKFDTVFSRVGGQVSAELDAFAQSVGRSRYELREMAATFGDTLKPMGFTQEAAASLAVDLSTLATDLGSFNDMPMDEALQRLQGTLIGSHENALAFGVIINENTLKAELAAQGWDTLTGAALEQAKVQARINLLMRGTTDAQGDAARTAGSFANQMRGLKSETGDAATELGQQLLPAATSLVSAFRRVVPIVRDAMAGAIAIVKNLSSIAGDIIRRLAQRLGVDFDNIASSAEGWGRGIAIQLARGIAAAAIAVVRALNEIGRMIAYWLKPNSPPRIAPNIDQWGREAAQLYVDGFARADFDALNVIGDAIEEFFREVGDSSDSSLPQRIGEAREATAEMIATFRETGDAMAAVDALERQIGELPDTLRDVATAQLDVIAAQERVAIEQEKVTAATREYEAAQAGVERARVGVERAQAGVITAQKRVEEAQKGVAQATGEYEAAQAGVERAQQRVNDVTADYEGILDPLRDKLRGLRDEYRAINDEYDAATEPLNREMEAIKDQQDAIKDAQRIEELRAEAKDASLSAEERRLAELEIAEIRLQQRIDSEERARRDALEPIEDAIEAKEREIDATERAREIAVSAAQEQVALAEKAAALAEQNVESAQKVVEQEQLKVAAAEKVVEQEQLKVAAAEKVVEQAGKQVEVAEAQLQAAQNVVSSAEDELKLRQDVVAEQRRQNDLAREQSQIIEENRSAAESAAISGSGVGAGVGAGEFALPDVESTVHDALDGVPDMVGQIMEDISAEFDPLRDALTESAELFGGLFDDAGTVIAQGRGFARDVVDFIGEMRSLWESDFLGLKSYASSQFHAIELRLSAFIKLFSGDWSGFLADMKMAAEIEFQATADVVGNLYGWSSPHLQSYWLQTEQWFRDTDWNLLGEQVVSSIVGVIGDLYSRTELKLNQFERDFWTWFDNVEWQELGYNVATRILETLTDLAWWFLQVGQWLTDLLVKMIEAAGNVDWGQVGSEVADGVAQGIRDRASTVIGAVQEMSEGAWQALRDFWDSRSPSERTKRLGFDIDEGLAIPLRGRTKAEAAVLAMSKRLMLALQPEFIPNLNDFIRADALTAALPSRIASQSGGFISEAAGNTDQSITLRIDQLIAGKGVNALDLEDSLAGSLVGLQARIARRGGF